MVKIRPVFQGRICYWLFCCCVFSFSINPLRLLIHPLKSRIVRLIQKSIPVCVCLESKSAFSLTQVPGFNPTSLLLLKNLYSYS
nr:MAG TPA: hypothetical protein [Caudoviricetes sp.]